MLNPDAQAVEAFVLNWGPQFWAERWLLLRKMAAKYPHARGRRLATIAGAALKLDEKKRRFLASINPARQARYQRDAQELRRRNETPFDAEALRAAWARLDPEDQAAALAMANHAGQDVVAELCGRGGDQRQAGRRAAAWIRAVLIDAVEFRFRPDGRSARWRAAT